MKDAYKGMTNIWRITSSSPLKPAFKGTRQNSRRQRRCVLKQQELFHPPEHMFTGVYTVRHVGYIKTTPQVLPVGGRCCVLLEARCLFSMHITSSYLKGQERKAIRIAMCVKGKDKVVPVLSLTEHHAMKAYWGLLEV
jgi:hypothetical protein